MIFRFVEVSRFYLTGSGIKSLFFNILVSGNILIHKIYSFIFFL